MFDFDIVGVPGEPARRTWTATDSLLYSLSVGAGRDPNLDELSLVTENSAGVTQRVVPSFAVLAANPGHRPNVGTFDPAALVFAEQAFELHQPLSVEGQVDVVQTVTGIYDKGTGALVAFRSEATDVHSGELLVTTDASVFIRGAGGFGGESGPSRCWQTPDGPPMVTAHSQTRPDQALLYRLTGDRNPLHSDPTFARRAGFDRPILHGLCTYGETCRLLMHALGEDGRADVVAMSARFSRPVLPGDRLTLAVWHVEGARYAFQTSRDDGTVVLDKGVAVLRNREGGAGHD